MNNIQMNGMMNSAVNFKANSAKVVTQTNKSGVFQAAVEKLAILQQELE